jgi:cytochrome c oxidase cbb3-type subunit III
VAEEHKEVDKMTGTATTGHEWDGIRELNTPLPRWWLWTFYLTIAFAVVYWVLYPAWPMINGATQGVLGWHARAAVETDLKDLHAERAPMMAKLNAATLEQIATTPQLLDFARAEGRVAFADNCAPCHGAGGGGAKGYPNLNDDDWLWGGKLAQIQQTITHGARSGDPQGHQGDMPAFGRDKILKPEEISTVADYVRSLSGLSVEKGADLAAGKKLFEANCAVCHGPDGKGNQQVGSANLTDKIWLYGSDKETIVQTVTNGRGGQMPAWGGRLPDATIKALTVYVWTFGGGVK